MDEYLVTKHARKIKGIGKEEGEEFLAITVFLDSNIIMADYKMTGQSFEELFNAFDELSNGENFNLILTEMNQHEILDNFKRRLNKPFKALSNFKSELIKLTETEKEFNPEELKAKIIKDYEAKLNDLFHIESSSKDAESNAFKRFYQQEMPFRDNKDEFKDALIWETVYEYAILNPDEKVYFVSNNHKDFAVENEEGEYKLHDHFDSLNDRIKYINGLNDFLVEIDYLKVHHFDFNEESEILENLRLELVQTYIQSSIFNGEMHDFFSNHSFSSDYFEGWGSDYSIYDIYELEIPDRNHVLETDNFIYIPISFIADIIYSVETKKPVYEQWAGDAEFIQSDGIEEQFQFECLVKYDPEEKKIIDIEEVNISFI